MLEQNLVRDYIDNRALCSVITCGASVPRAGRMTRDAWTDRDDAGCLRQAVADLAAAHPLGPGGHFQPMLDRLIDGIDWAQSQFAAPPPIGPGHWIVVVGDVPGAATQALAAGLDRPLQHFDTVSSAAEWARRASPQSILVIGGFDLPARFAVEQLDLACGFLPIFRHRDLWPTVLAAILRHRLTCRPAMDLVLVPPSDRPAVEMIGAALWMTGPAPDADIHKLIATPKRVFGLVSHSDGVSSFLGPANFCVAESAKVPLDSSLGVAPICMRDGYCYRFCQPRPIAQAKGLLIAPDQLRADVFLNLSCWGSHFGSVIHPGNSLGYGFFHSMSLRAQITTTSVLPVDTGLMAHGLDLLVGGATLGEGSLALNRQTARDITGGPDAFLLYGDPAYRPIPFPAASPVRKMAAPPPSRCARPARTPVGLRANQAFLQRLMSNIAARKGHYEVPSAKALDAKLAKAQAAGDAAVAVLEAEVLAVLGDQARLAGSIIMHDWLPFFRTMPTLPDSTACHICGHAVARKRYHADFDPGLIREVHICQSCGVLYDGPSDFHLTLSVPTRAPARHDPLEILLSPGSGANRGLTAVETPRPEHAVAFPVRRFHGRPQSETWLVAADFPIGAATLSGFVFRDGALAVARLPIACQDAAAHDPDPTL